MAGFFNEGYYIHDYMISPYILSRLACALRCLYKTYFVLVSSKRLLLLSWRPHSWGNSQHWDLKRACIWEFQHFDTLAFRNLRSYGGTTLNIVFSVTYSLKLCNVIFIYCTSHILPKMSYEFFGNYKTTTLLGKKKYNNSKNVQHCVTLHKASDSKYHM